MNEKVNQKIKNSTFLVTGGAGFIGSNLVEHLLKHEAKHVRVLDNLSTGSLDNLAEFQSYRNFEFINGDIRDLNTCNKAIEGIEYITHQAALGSVPRSINDPLTTNNVNLSGSLNMLLAARNSKLIKRYVYAASSSTYGDSIQLPKKEGEEGNPLSPYAITKVVNELYSDVFSKIYKFNTIGLRYFNVFGPKQSPTNPYAAVIPKFIHCNLQNINPTIYGDGKTSRDFTYIQNVTQANILALLNSDKINKHQVYNVACGSSTSLNELNDIICSITNNHLSPVYESERIGDVKHSLADITKIKQELGYSDIIEIKDGLKQTIEWIKNRF